MLHTRIICYIMLYINTKTLEHEKPGNTQLHIQRSVQSKYILTQVCIFYFFVQFSYKQNGLSILFFSIIMFHNSS